MEELEDGGGDAGGIREVAARLWEESEVLRNFRRLQFDERLISTRYSQHHGNYYESAGSEKGPMDRRQLIPSPGPSPIME